MVKISLAFGRAKRPPYPSWRQKHADTNSTTVQKVSCERPATGPDLPSPYLSLSNPVSSKARENMVQIVEWHIRLASLRVGQFESQPQHS